MKTKILISLTLFFCSCAPQYAQDPNANILVTSQYENEPPKIVFLPNSSCKSKIHCNNKKGADCAAALYNKSEPFIKEGKKLANKTLYLSAQLEYLQAMCRLSIAEITLQRSKTENYEDWQVAIILGLEKKIKERIKLCERQIFLLKWKRQ